MLSRSFRLLGFGCAAALFGLAACAPPAVAPAASPTAAMPKPMPKPTGPPSPDPRVGLGAGLFDAEEAVWNLRVLSHTPPPRAFIGETNSDLAFKDEYAIQGNYNGIMVWDLSNPRAPGLVTEYVCPASQSDVSVYGDLLFVSGEGLGGRLDCGTEGVPERISGDRLRGIRIFDISDIRNPDYIANVQTCRGSHTHSVLKDPDDDENVYVYVSGSSSVRPAEELPGCSASWAEGDEESALFRIEVIRVPLDRPEEARIVSSPRIFEDLAPVPKHGLAPDDLAEIERARAAGALVVEINGQERVLDEEDIERYLEELVELRGGTGAPTEADRASLVERLPEIFAARIASGRNNDPRRGPTQCHDITLYPEIGLGGGACEGYGLLLDISDPVNPTRLDAVADSNFAYWHSATFNNAGDKVLFTDEWGGGGQPKCRATDPYAWGANALFTVDGGALDFASYYKMPAAQTTEENCVAHNGSLIPIPGRDVMVQAWYQGGISVFDWTDAANPIEIAFHDRGPIAPDEFVMGGSWSVYWYNGLLVSSEIARGLDVFELTPSAYLTQNEIDAANTVELDYLNAQGQPRFVWPPSFALAHAYLDQLQRHDDLAAAEIAAVRTALDEAEEQSGLPRHTALTALLAKVDNHAAQAEEERAIQKLQLLSDAIRDLAADK